MSKFPQKIVAVSSALLLLVLAACGAQPTDTPKTPPNEPTSATTPSLPDTASTSSQETAPVPAENGMLFTKDFGTYTVPLGWVENAEHSTTNKFFYIVPGTEEDAQPNNISVESGVNKYAAKDHELFRTAIMKQLLMQLQNTGAELNGAGSYTKDNKYLLYIFTITEDNTPMATTQYYIVDDYKYVLVQETAPKDAEDANTVAQTIVDSFTWAQD